MEYAKKIINPRPNINEELIAKCAEMTDVLSVSAVYSDAFKRDGVMDHEIKFRSVNKPFIGTALTVKLKPGDIVDCLPIFDIAQPGDVVVIDANGTPNTSIWGGLMSGLARAAGDRLAVLAGQPRHGRWQEGGVRPRGDPRLGAVAATRCSAVLGAGIAGTCRRFLPPATATRPRSHAKRLNEVLL